MTTTVQDVIDALHRHKNVLLYGPPGTGKSHLMTEVARKFAASHASAPAISIETASESNPLVVTPAPAPVTRWVTFHQGYSYEDFVIGLRPKSNGTAGFSLVPRAGVLLEVAAEAKSAPTLLVIDEINRGNASRIFGEFITLIEPDKRLGDDGQPKATTVTLTLPYLSSGEVLDVETFSGTQQLSRDFAMPAAVYTLASMNSVDKSIAPIDTAIRRRFHVINIFPTDVDIRTALGMASAGKLDVVGGITSIQGLSTLAASTLSLLNRGIGLQLGPDFMLGQWYLSKFPQDIDEAKKSFVESWHFRIVPQLIELFHGRAESLINLLKLRDIPNYSGISVVQPDSREEEDGGAAYLTTATTMPTTEEVLTFLQRLVGAPMATKDPTQEDAAVAAPSTADVGTESQAVPGDPVATAGASHSAPGDATNPSP